jgi:hypothetical protein
MPTIKKQTWANLSVDNKLTILTQVAAKTGLPENAIEKDFWVSMVLKALFSLEYSHNLIFKGGTSLSKGWQLIERFSEDIDLAINPVQFGFSGTTIIVKNQRDKLRKASKKFIETILKDDFKKTIEEMGLKNYCSIEAEQVKESDRDPMVLFVNYKSVLKEKNTYIAEKVKLEISCRSLVEPSDKIHLRSMIASENPTENYSEKEFSVRVAAPGRTFLEKVFLLHEEFNRPNGCVNLNRLTRHMYDIEKMMDKPFAKQAMEDPTLYTEIVKHRSIMTAWSGLDYKAHHPSTICFVPPASVLPKLRDDYKKMQDNFIYGDSLSFEKLMERLQELQNRFRNLECNTEFFNKLIDKD